MTKLHLNRQFVRHRMADLDIASYAELSRRAGLHRITVSTILTRGSCSWDTLAALAEVLQCKPGDLLAADAPPK